MAKLPVKKVTGVSKKPLQKKGLLHASVTPILIPRKHLEKSKLEKQKNKGIAISLKSLHRSTKTTVLISDNTIKSKKTTPITGVRETDISKSKRTERKPFLATLVFSFDSFLPSTQTVASIARIAGVFFVTSGAILALLNLPSIDAYETQQATVLNATDTSITDFYTMQTGTVSSTSGVIPSTINKKPFARIFIESISVANISNIFGIVPVMVTVPIATHVNLILEYKSGGQLAPLGAAFRIDATTWRYYFDTRNVPNGGYKLRAAIVNEYNSYEQTNDIYYFVSNQAPKPNTSQTSSNGSIIPSGTIDGETASSSLNKTLTTSDISTGAITTSSTTSTDSTVIKVIATTSASVIHSVSLTIHETAPLQGKVPLRISAIDASNVIVYSQNSETRIRYFVGTANLLSSGEWQIDWNTEKVPDGNYELAAHATFGTTTVMSQTRKTSVKNIVDVPLVLVIPVTPTTTPSIEQATTSEIIPLSVAKDLKPTINVSLSKSGTVSGFVDMIVTTSPVTSVEMYAVSRTSLTPYFLGLAKSQTATEWKYIWDTKQSPNREYYVYARIKTEYGNTDGSRILVNVFNEDFALLTTQQEKSIDLINTADDALINVTSNELSIPESPKDSYPAPQSIYMQPIRTFVETINTDEPTKNEIQNLLSTFNVELNKKLALYADAVRNNNMSEAEQILRDIDEIKKQIATKLPSDTENKKIEEHVNSYLTQLVVELVDITRKNEAILKDRLGEALTKDSDGDSVSDYDEINLYHTNPFAADTDGDGYIDSVEIRLGYNPHDSNSESLVVYESPQDTGLVRDDILKVKSVTTLTNETENVSEKTPVRAIISGTGLPSSFVTLYVYSTPIVVTVKTDTEGNWSYIFDKELEEGNHEVYVGMTDNAGRIVAKSSPLPFVKTAEAFTNADAAAMLSPSNEPSLIQGNAMLLVASIGVVALGLVLILLGLHVSANRKEPLMFASA